MEQQFYLTVDNNDTTINLLRLFTENVAMQEQISQLNAMVS